MRSESLRLQLREERGEEELDREIRQRRQMRRYPRYRRGWSELLFNESTCEKSWMGQACESLHTKCGGGTRIVKVGSGGEGREIRP